MNSFYRFSSLVLLAFIFASIQPITAQVQSKINVVSNAHQNSRADFVFDLPFVEDWEYHTFTHNLWEISDDAWVIDVYNGNDGASAKFQGSSNQTNYFSTLTSNWLAGSAVGRDTLRFDLKLSDLAANGTEFFFIKIFDGTNYHTIDSIANNGSFDWTSYTYVITNATGGNDFKVVFETSGAASSNILDWHIDNIKVSRGCDPPTDLYGETYDKENIGTIVRIKWNTPDCLLPIEPWEHWDTGENFSGIGLTNGGTFSVAARWDAGSLSAKDGDTISKIKYIISDNQFAFLVLHIWTGENAANVIYTDTISTPPPTNTWNVVTINDPIVLDASLEYWVGYDIINHVPGTHPAGTDGGPAISGFGDKISTDGSTWANLSDMGLNYNWNIEMYVGHAPPGDSTLKKFVLYKSLDSYNYQPYDSIDYVSGQTMFDYLDYNVVWGNIYWYKLNAMWAKNGDTCISPFAKRKNLPIFDFISIFLIDGIDESQTSNKLTLYPNPASNTITVDAESVLTSIVIYDLQGKVVIKSNPLHDNKVSINIALLQSGIYLIKAKTTTGVLSRKFVKK